MNASPERLALGAVVAAVAALLAAQGVAAGLGGGGAPLGLGVGAAAVALTAVAVLAQRRTTRSRARWIAGGATVLAGLALGAATDRWLPALGAALAAGLFATGLTERVPARLPETIDGARRRHPRLAWLWIALAACCVLQTARFSAFMQDVELRWGTALPTRPPHHMCLSAYLRGAELSQTEPSALYEPERYAAETHTRVEGMSRWLRDPFMYPPPALLPARLALAISGRLAPIRTIWFAVQALFFLAVSLALASELSERARGPYLWLWPALFASLPVLYNFEYGQAHLFTLTLAVAAMMAFRRERLLSGGLLLGGAIAVKIFPGVLMAYALFRRRWGEAVAGAGGALLWGLVAVPIVGVEAYEAFFTEQLPRLVTGRAFATFVEHATFDTPHLSPTALVFTLERLGVPGMSWTVARAVSWVFTLVVLGACALAARRPDRPAIWLALLALGASRSPYAPAAYVMAGTLWLVVALAGETEGRVRWSLVGTGALLGVAPFVGYLPLLWAFPKTAGVVTTITVAVVLNLSCWACVRVPHRRAKQPSS